MEQGNPNIRKRRAKTSLEGTKIGYKKIAEDAKKLIFKKAFDRKMLLKIPNDILEKNPDKHFVWVNLPRLQNAGYYHPEGYSLFRAEEVDTKSPSNKLDNHFMKSPDGLIHRNEMVLAYLPKEEYEQRQFEEQVIRGKTNLEDVITNNPNLASEFMPYANVETETKEYPLNNQEALNG